MRYPRERLIEEHMGHVRRTARAFRSPLDANELTAVGYLALVDAAMKFDRDPEDFWAYAYVHVKGAMIDAVRRWTRYDRVKREGAPASWDVEVAEEMNPESFARERFDIFVLTDELKRDKRAGKMFLAGEFGYTLEELAAEDGVTPSRISQLKKKAREALRRAV